MPEQGVINSIIKYISTLEEVIIINSNEILGFKEYLISVMGTSLELTKQIENNTKTLLGGFYATDENLAILELMQNAQAEAITTLFSLSKVISLTGIWNTVTIIAIIAYLIFTRNKKGE